MKTLWNRLRPKSGQDLPKAAIRGTLSAMAGVGLLMAFGAHEYLPQVLRDSIFYIVVAVLGLMGIAFLAILAKLIYDDYR